MRVTRYLRLSDEAQRGLILGARDGEPVRGLTHGYYKYPARFSPAFARAAIETFTKPGDLVLDPHAGGVTRFLLKSPKHRESLEISWGRPYHGGHDRDLIHLRFCPLLPPS